MNYIKEINAFHDRMMTNPISVGAKVLWSSLMHVNNKAHWVKEFSIAESLICGLTGLSSSAFKRARAELKDKGLITYRSRGTKAPMYQMVSLVMEDAGMEGEEDVVQEVSQEVIQQKKPKKLDEGATEDVTEEVGDVPSQVADEVVDPLYKQKEIKRNENKTTTSTSSCNDPILFFKKNFVRSSTQVLAQICEWESLLSEELVLEAMKRALDSGHSTWIYVCGILGNWKKGNCKTLHDVMIYEDQFRANRSRRQGEVVPDWYWEQKRERKEREERGRLGLENLA